MENIKEEFEVIDEKATILKALSHPIRLCIVKGLMSGTGEYNVSRMQGCLQIPQSTLSQHLSKLKDLGILEGKRNGLEVSYTVINKDAENIIRALFPVGDRV